MKRFVSGQCRSCWIAIAGVAVLASGMTLLAVRSEVPAQSDTAGIQQAATCDVPAERPRCFFHRASVRLARRIINLPTSEHPYSPLLRSVAFTDARGNEWMAPAGTLTDGASIPRIFVPLVGEPRAKAFLAAAALHDAYCGAGNEALPQYRSRSWEETHRMFYDGLRVAGAGETRAKIMFAAVYLRGPRWDDPTRSLDDVPDWKLIEEMKLCIRFIERTNPSRAEIERWMREREAELRTDTSATLQDRPPSTERI